jgi:5-methylcytosine-specific restriction enzyme subunit McrC
VTRSETIRESAEVILDLDEDMAAALTRLGKNLAGKKSWWGHVDDGDTSPDRTVIRVDHRGGARWAVRVNDAVGVIAVPGLQLIVRPKIPLGHFIYLLERGGAMPRLEEDRATADVESSLWTLVARWYVDQAERVLRHGLLRDYVEVEDQLTAVQGRLLVPETTRLFYRGQPAVAVEFDEYAFDTPLNRVLRAAAGFVAASPVLDGPLRRRALRILARMDDVGLFQPGDINVIPDQRAAFYGDALVLARHVIAGQGRTIRAGRDATWTFLIRTPDLVEAGLRTIMRSVIVAHDVRKEGRVPVGSPMSFNPDLVIGHGTAVGDVKYKLSKGDWPRGDLYQLVTFAEAFGTDRGILVRFREPSQPALPDFYLGDKWLREITWVADPGVEATVAADAFSAMVLEWASDLQAVISSHHRGVEASSGYSGDGSALASA